MPPTDILASAMPRLPPHPGRDQGDLARDLRDWNGAIDAYRSYLEASPTDAAIWVQLGHAFKELGRLSEAETAYRCALDLAPADSDILLQLGHLMKLFGRNREAIRFYEQSVEADDESPARRELVALVQSNRAPVKIDRINPLPDPVLRVAGAAKIYFQIDDVLVYLSSHKTVSGIQRVQIEVIRDVLGRTRETIHAFVYTEPFGTRIWVAPNARLRDIVDYLDEPEIDHPTLLSMINRLKAEATPTRLLAGSSFVMLGAFWSAINNSNVLAMLKQAGVSLGVYFYDFIPVEYPELCDPHLVNYFTQFLAEALCLLDFALAISEFTAGEVRRFIRREGFPEIPVVAVPLAHSLSTSRDGRIDSDSYLPVWTGPIRDLKGRDFVLYVSTIEARKNHKYLFDVWKLLLAEGLEVPDLVFVGRYGWRVNEFIEQLKSTNYLDGRIHILHDLSDRELETLYRECRFTVFTSIVEGWGLPVGESLAYGKLCVSSNASSMPEVGGDLIAYVDPLNIREGLQTIRHLLTDPSAVSSYEAGIRERFTPRSWAEVANDLLTAVETLSSAHPGVSDNAFVPVIEARERIQLSDYSPFTDPFSERLPRRPRQRVKRLLLATSWHCPENFGAWMEGIEGSIRFATTLAPGERVVVYLAFTSTPSAEANLLTITDPSGGRVRLAVPTGANFSVRCVCPTDAKSEVFLTLAVSGEIRFNADDLRKICVGLVSLTYVAEQDAAGRAEIIERQLFDDRLKLYIPASA